MKIGGNCRNTGTLQIAWRAFCAHLAEKLKQQISCLWFIYLFSNIAEKKIRKQLNQYFKNSKTVFKLLKERQK